MEGRPIHPLLLVWHLAAPTHPSPPGCRSSRRVFPSPRTAAPSQYVRMPICGLCLGPYDQHDALAPSLRHTRTYSDALARHWLALLGRRHGPQIAFGPLEAIIVLICCRLILHLPCRLHSSLPGRARFDTDRQWHGASASPSTCYVRVLVLARMCKCACDSGTWVGVVHLRKATVAGPPPRGGHLRRPLPGAVSPMSQVSGRHGQTAPDVHARTWRRQSCAPYVHGYLSKRRRSVRQGCFSDMSLAGGNDF